MTASDAKSPKRQVKLTLNADLVAQARAVTDNLSAVIELLLTAYVSDEKQRRAAEAGPVRDTIALWNRFGARVGSFADEHSTL